MATVYQKGHFGVVSPNDGSVRYTLKAQMREELSLIIFSLLSSIPLPIPICLWLNFAKFLSRNLALIYHCPTSIK